MINISHISCVIIVKNAAETIVPVLESLTAFDEVVLYDNGSDDGTQDLAKEYPNVNLVEGAFLGFGETKQKAAGYAKNNWVLSLDADEVLSETFIEGLKELSLDDHCVYSILRSNFYKDREVKHCWGKDIIVRLYNRTKTGFNSNKVHEHVVVDGMDVIPLQGAVKHYPYQNISQFIIKLDKYSSLFAEENKGLKSSSPLKAFLSSNFSFFKTYIIKRGFMDGSPGLVIAFSHMATNFYKYMKLYELNKTIKNGVGNGN
ncbi:glycosyltransferase family 2 protein [uncultured Neptuniibacter sp.]|uniref:glycosyltransferase family 2 protein n=1 Tax=uncultured Neptuniibacter sp. TaxID=502143 RepID=UPI002634A11B|nr:glycosyltransferase family 2 protein [uncultured Neptuniibacter sp.]